MKRILILILLSQPFRVFAQDAEILDFCQKSVGKKFGGGLCYEFVLEAAKQVYGYSDWQEVAHAKKVKTPKAGDVIIFNNAVAYTSGGKNRIHHTGIIGNVVKKEGVMIVYYYEQNVGGSPVQYGFFYPEDSDMRKISYIRLRKS